MSCITPMNLRIMDTLGPLYIERLSSLEVSRVYIFWSILHQRFHYNYLIFFQRVDIASDEPRFSSSALDTESILLQLGFFWKNLEWPIASDAIGYLITVIEVSTIKIINLKVLEPS